MTPAYASPEMLEGHEPDPRDDIFALACIAYELLTGHHPFGRTPSTVARDAGIIPHKPARLTKVQWRALATGLAFRRSDRNAHAELLVAGLASPLFVKHGRAEAV